MKRISALAAVPVAAAGLLIAAPQAAPAATDQLCVDTVVLTWDPPITNTPRTTDFTATGQLVNCSNPAYPSGAYIDTGTVADASCTSLLDPGSATRVLTWNNPAGDSSVFSYNWTATRVNGNIVVQFIGAILPGGAFGTENAKEVVAVPALDLLACSSTGVSRLFGAGTLEIGT